METPVESMVENTEGMNRMMRPGLYMSRGKWSPDSQLVFTPSNDESTQLCVRAVEARSQEAKAASEGRWSVDDRYLPAIVMIHRPDHYDSLQPNVNGTVLVLERKMVTLDD